MRKILWVLILAVLTLANAWMTREQSVMLSQAAQLRAEKAQQAQELAGLQDRLRELQVSHEYYIGVSTDINSRLAVVEGRAGP